MYVCMGMCVCVCCVCVCVCMCVCVCVRARPYMVICIYLTSRILYIYCTKLHLPTYIPHFIDSIDISYT